jgi:hypothetical protein
MLEYPVILVVALVSADVLPDAPPELASVKLTTIAETIRVKIIATDDIRTLLFLNIILSLLNLAPIVLLQHE